MNVNQCLILRGDCLMYKPFRLIDKLSLVNDPLKLAFLDYVYAVQKNPCLITQIELQATTPEINCKKLI